MNDVKSLLEKLIRFESITPNDSGCQNFMMDFLKQHGFDCQRFDHFPVANFLHTQAHSPHC